MKTRSSSTNLSKLARADISCQFMKTRSLCRTVYKMNGLYTLQFLITEKSNLSLMKKSKKIASKSIHKYKMRLKYGKKLSHCAYIVEMEIKFFGEINQCC